MVLELVKTPVYQQLNEMLRGLIRSGEFRAEQQFMTERQVCDRFGVSRPTANKALSNLVSEGLLEFRKGVGTFVRGGLLAYDQRALISFTQKAITAGKTPATRVLLLQDMPTAEAAPPARAALKAPPDDRLTYVERLRLADGVPVILERRYIVSRFCPNLSAVELEGSLYSLWTEKYRLDIIGAEQVIRAVLLRGQDARLLGVANGAAGLLVVSAGFLSGGAPLWWERTLYRGDAYEFYNRLGPIPTGRLAGGFISLSEVSVDR